MPLIELMLSFLRFTPRWCFSCHADDDWLLTMLILRCAISLSDIWYFFSFIYLLMIIDRLLMLRHFSSFFWWYYWYAYFPDDDGATGADDMPIIAITPRWFDADYWVFRHIIICRWHDDDADDADYDDDYWLFMILPPILIDYWLWWWCWWLMIIIIIFILMIFRHYLILYYYFYWCHPLLTPLILFIYFINVATFNIMLLLWCFCHLRWCWCRWRCWYDFFFLLMMIFTPFDDDAIASLLLLLLLWCHPPIISDVFGITTPVILSPPLPPVIHVTPISSLARPRFDDCRYATNCSRLSPARHQVVVGRHTVQRHQCLMSIGATPRCHANNACHCFPRSVQ